MENALVAHPEVAEAAVIAIPDPKWQERPLAVVVLKPGGAVTSAELRAFLAIRFAKWQLPDEVVFVNELPHTSTGKLLKSELRQRYRDWHAEVLVASVSDAANHRSSISSKESGHVGKRSLIPRCRRGFQ